jgi:hypothetical protein
VGAIVALSLRRWKRDHERAAGARAAVPRLDPALARRLDRELADFDG